MMKKSVLPMLAVALLLFAVSNAYLALKNFVHMQKIVAQAMESSGIEASISSVRSDLTEMETGQRGYLLTGNAAYLQPYTEAKARIASDFSKLRAGLALRGERERSSESEIESLAQSKEAELERTISLRQRGYRHRAFKVVDSDEGMGYMEKARSLLTALSTNEKSISEKVEKNREAAAGQSLRETISCNSGLLLMTGLLVWFVRRQSRKAEQEVARVKEELGQRDLQLAKLTSILSNQARSKTSAMEENARLLLQEYGGFLPRQGHECAEQIMEASVEMERLRRDLVGNSTSVSEPEQFVEFVA